MSASRHRPRRCRPPGGADANSAQDARGYAAESRGRGEEDTAWASGTHTRATARGWHHRPKRGSRRGGQGAQGLDVRQRRRPARGFCESRLPAICRRRPQPHVQDDCSQSATGALLRRTNFSGSSSAAGRARLRRFPCTNRRSLCAPIPGTLQLITSVRAILARTGQHLVQVIDLFAIEQLTNAIRFHIRERHLMVAPLSRMRITKQGSRLPVRNTSS